MQSKSAALRDQINEWDAKIQAASNLAERNQLEAERNELNNELQAALAEEAQEQAHADRIREAKAESSRFLDDIYIADVPVAESGLSELAFKILNSKVTEKHVAAIGKLSLAMNEQQAQHQEELKTLTDRMTQAEANLNHFQTHNKELEIANYQLGLENNELDTKARKGAEMLFEATETIEKLNKQIDDYKKAELLAPQPAVTLSTSEQVAKQEAELKASRIKVTSMTVDPNDFAKRTWTIVLALTGEKKEINYLEKGNYTLVDEATAEQLRADEANKKAEQEALQAAIPTLNEPDVLPVNRVTEEEAPAQEVPFQVQTAESGLVDQSLPLSGAETDEIEREDMKLFPDEYLVTMKQFNALAARVENIERHANIQAVA